MPSYIITISKDTPEHWDYAVQAGFWDFTKNPDIEPGDKLYFWQSGNGTREPGRFIGVAEAISPTYPREDRHMPWRVDDSRRALYKTRVDLIPLTRDLDSTITARDLADHELVPRRGGGAPVMNAGLFSVSMSAGERWLQENLLNQQGQTVDLEFAREGAQVRIDPIPDEDNRDVVWQQIRRRQGQGAFRQGLLDAYERRCAVSGSDVEVLLDAAHIAPYKGGHTQRVDNGILLRTDLHTLFDAHLMTFVYDADGELSVHVSPSVGSPYRDLDGQRVRLPQRKDQRPVDADLKNHQHKCRWLVMATQS